MRYFCNSVGGGASVARCPRSKAMTHALALELSSQHRGEGVRPEARRQDSAQDIARRVSRYSNLLLYHGARIDAIAKRIEAIWR